MFFCSQGFGFTADGLARSGCYYADCAATKCSLPARDPRLARALWETSERLCGMETGTALPRVDGGSFGGGETFDGVAMREGGRRGGGDDVGAISSPPRGVSMSASSGSSSATNGEGTGTNGERKAREIGEGGRGASGIDDDAVPPASPVTSMKVTPSKSGRWGLGA